MALRNYLPSPAATASDPPASGRVKSVVKLKTKLRRNTRNTRTVERHPTKDATGCLVPIKSLILSKLVFRGGPDFLIKLCGLCRF